MSTHDTTPHPNAVTAPNNVQEDANLNAIAREFAKASLARKMSLTQAKELIKRVWKEEISKLPPKEPSPEIRLALQESPEQIEFRQKATRFLEAYPQYLGQFNPAICVEVLCLAYKRMLIDKVPISYKHLIPYVFNHITFALPQENLYKARVKKYVNHLFFNANNFLLNITAKGNVDFSAQPYYAHWTPQQDSETANVSCCPEFQKFKKNNHIKASQNGLEIVQVIWIIATFF